MPPEEITGAGDLAHLPLLCEEKLRSIGSSVRGYLHITGDLCPNGGHLIDLYNPGIPSGDAIMGLTLSQTSMGVALHRQGFTENGAETVGVVGEIKHDRALLTRRLKDGEGVS